MRQELGAIGWLWASVRWTDILDIAIMAFLIYRTLLLMRGTRAFQSLVGLMFLLGLYFVAERLELTSVRWMLDKFIVYIVLAVIILFQQDIRRALARAGGRFFVSLRSSTEVPILEDIIKASFALASRRIGALIAIERFATLDEYIEASQPLDAQVSDELLMSLFHPTSPLHDGAVIVQKDRIAAAKVFLPLTLSKEVSRFFGTRHRAALGLTEETDAIVIIVSEERGTVSLVQHGRLIPTSDANELRERLQEIFQGTRIRPEPKLQPSENT
jgi:diadenylate cyclase